MQDTYAMTSTPAVRCTDCGFAWNSTTMAEGLRTLGSCPRCAGALHFRRAEPAGEPVAARPTPAVAPHLVLGLPRKDRTG
jgi:ubiquitin